ncbi:hemolysin family protein [Treponema sp.]|uniref:hemolysin family protein n=1 Tax=Treponema sp. TaxID=166 RepID=UPI003F0E4E0A
MSVLYISVSLSAMVFLLFLGAFFSATETSYTSLSRISVRQMLKENARNSIRVYKIKSELDLLISTVLIGTNFVNTLNSSIATAFAIRVFGAEYISVATAVVTVMVIVFAEIIPKTYAGFNQKQVAQMSAVPVLAVQRMFFPVIWLFFQFTRFLDFLEKKLIKAHRPLITEEELKALIAIGENEGTLEQDERKMLERIFEFSDLTVRNVMRHRSLVRHISVSESFEGAIKIFEDTGYSRILVFEDSSEEVVGVLYFKDILFADKESCASRDFVRKCMQPVLFVPETLSAVELLKKFKAEKNNFAVVVNEYGEMTGIVTLDSILREVFGRITDEHGMADVPPEKRISLVGINEFLVPGDMRLDDLNNVLYMNLSSENFDTLGGWLLERFDELPAVGSVYKKNGTVFIVEDQSARRIQTVRIRL